MAMVTIPIIRAAAISAPALSMTAAAIIAIIAAIRAIIGTLVIAIATIIVTVTGIATVRATTGRIALARRVRIVRRSTHPAWSVRDRTRFRHSARSGANRII